MVAAGAQAAAGARAAARPAFARPRADDTFGRFGLSRRRAVPILRAPRAVAGGVSRPARREPRPPRDVPDAALESLLANVRVALRVSGPAETHASAMIWGDGENLGMPVRWCLRHDGARFLEEALGPELSYVSGCDHTSLDESMDGSEPAVSPEHTHVTAWETDFTGYTQRLALDDREAALLFGWTRCHFWAKPEARSFLRLELLSREDVEDGSYEDGSDESSDDAFYVAASLRDGLLRAVIAIDKETHLPTRMTARVCGDEERWTFAEWAPLSDFASNENGSNGSNGSSVSKRKAPSLNACEAGMMVPGLTTLEGSAGGKQTFRVTGARRNSGVTEKRKEAFYRAPRTSETKRFYENENGDASNETADASVASHERNAGGVSFVRGVAPEVVIERGHRSSHVLVCPLIDGIDVGPFILDTGASGLVITKAAAEKLRLQSFGEVFVSGVSGKVPCRFRRASEMRLGPLLVDRPVFMEMALGGIVSGVSDPVAGIVGFDAFKSAVVEVGPGGAPVRIHDPRTFKAHEKWAWHEIALVSNVPHAFATFGVARDTTRDTTLDDDDEASPVTAANDDDTRDGGRDISRSRETSVSGAFMIDSGAGGADAIFHERAVEALGLRSILPPPPTGGARGTSRVRGVGGSDGESSGATRAYRGELEWLELVSTGTVSSAKKKEEALLRLGSGGRFEKLNVLLAADAGFDLSEHSVGLICANALNTRRVVYDVPNRRVALLIDGVDVSPCESLLCAGPLDWERVTRTPDGTALPTPTAEELELFGESLRFGQNE